MSVGWERKGKSRTQGPHFYNQPYDLEQAKVGRPTRERKKKHLLQAWQESWHKGSQHSTCFSKRPQRGY